MFLPEGPMVLFGCMVMHESTARLAQSAERKALSLVVVGSSPTVGAFHWNQHVSSYQHVWRCRVWVFSCVDAHILDFE